MSMLHLTHELQDMGPKSLWDTGTCSFHGNCTVAKCNSPYWYSSLLFYCSRTCQGSYTCPLLGALCNRLGSPWQLHTLLTSEESWILAYKCPWQSNPYKQQTAPHINYCSWWFPIAPCKHTFAQFRIVCRMLSGSTQVRETRGPASSHSSYSRTLGSSHRNQRKLALPSIYWPSYQLWGPKLRSTSIYPWPMRPPCTLSHRNCCPGLRTRHLIDKSCTCAWS